MQHGYPFSLYIAALDTSVPQQEAIVTVTRILKEHQIKYNNIKAEHIGVILQMVLSKQTLYFQ